MFMSGDEILNFHEKSCFFKISWIKLNSRNKSMECSRSKKYAWVLRIMWRFWCHHVSVCVFFCDEQNENFILFWKISVWILSWSKWLVETASQNRVVLKQYSSHRCKISKFMAGNYSYFRVGFLVRAHVSEDRFGFPFVQPQLSSCEFRF